MFKRFKKSLFIVLVFIMLMGLNTKPLAAAQYTRVEGRNRYATSLKTTGEKESDTLVLASGKNFADSLSATNLINGLDAKLLLVGGSEDINSLIREQGIKKVYIVGGESTITKEFEKEISVPTIRVSGSNRYETNQESLKISGYTSVGIATGENYADALSSAKFLSENKLGLLLVNKSNENLVTKDYQVKYIFGGTSSVSYQTADAIRISGKNRVDTSMKIDEMTQAKNIILVSGDDFADALSAVNLIDVKDASILLAPKAGQADFAGLVKEEDPVQVTVVGGQSVLSDQDVLYALEGRSNPKQEEVQLEGLEEEVEEVQQVEVQQEKVEEVQVQAAEKPLPLPMDLPTTISDGQAYQDLVQAGLSKKEAELAVMINEYRASRGLAQLKISKSLTQVARTHVADSNSNHPILQRDTRGIQGNLHSWSVSNKWTGGAYTPDHKYASMMWSKPRELTSYPGDGFEISTGYLVSAENPNMTLPEMTPSKALDGWKKSPGHNAVIVGEGSWKNLTTFGVAVDGAYSHVWFGNEADPAGYFN